MLPSAVMQLLPTPRTTDTNGAGTHGDGGMDLRTAVTLLPTPTATRYGNNQSPSPGAAVRHGLDSIDKLLPTPTVADSRGTRNATSGRKAGSKHHAGTTLSDVFWTGETPQTAMRTSKSTSDAPTNPDAGTCDSEERCGAAPLLPTPTVADSERSSATYPRGNPTLSGALTNRRSGGGKKRSAGPRPDQPSLDEALDLS
jgi:hypothetical protein